jgi:hypothetical protein
MRNGKKNCGELRKVVVRSIIVTCFFILMIKFHLTFSGFVFRKMNGAFASLMS